APWVLAKSEENYPRLKTVLYNLTEVLTITTSLLAPFMPETSEKVLKQLNTKFRNYSDMDKFGLYESGTVVDGNAEMIFARLDFSEVEKKAAEIAAKYAVPEEKEEKQDKKPEITIDDFAKIQLKVALVEGCEKVEKSKKLLKLSLKVGSEKRTVASGIADYYKPEELIGKKVVLVYNLKPAKLCGIESQGMILCAEKDGKVTIVTPSADLPDGAEVR
ncbi:MAG: methionine--tRNA ligase subunit beta, partial [Clostridia bacterium]|nr:methionine--tRNA ligase subunit beta [Clostridia bacterium]